MCSSDLNQDDMHSFHDSCWKPHQLATASEPPSPPNRSASLYIGKRDLSLRGLYLIVEKKQQQALRRNDRGGRKSNRATARRCDVSRPSRDRSHSSVTTARRATNHAPAHFLLLVVFSGDAPKCFDFRRFIYDASMHGTPAGGQRPSAREHTHLQSPDEDIAP